MSMRILLSGASGRIGRQIESLVDDLPDASIAARATRAAFFADGATGDVLIDFSRPALCRASVAYAAERGIPCVVGTTGLDADAMSDVEAAARRVAVCTAANFSVGVNLLLALVERASAGLGEEFDVEIAEVHHRWKVDAPSGTALDLGRAVARGRGMPEERAVAEPRRDARKPGEIGYQSARGGNVAGDHTVRFLGDGERIELAHVAGDRTVFARGALRAARWVVGQPPGRYGMSDVLAAET
jgi:4-hydroxy-tetrahydrodipicolinate reductase